MSDPDPHVGDQVEERFLALYDEAHRTIRRTMLVMITFSFFCVLTLGTSDVDLLSSASTLEVPFADAEITYTTFGWVGPLVLTALAVYLHIHLGYVSHVEEQFQKQTGKSPERLWDQSLPYLFNIQRPVLASFLADAAFYLIAPLVSLYFCYRVQFRPEVVWLQVFAVSNAGWLAIVCLRRGWWSVTSEVVGQAPVYWNFKRLLVPAAIVLLGLLSLFVPPRTLHLAGADLSGDELHAIDLSGADLRRADLRNATLSEVRLVGADFDGADLRGIRGLDCPALESAHNWSRSYRDARLGCGEDVPEPP